MSAKPPPSVVLKTAKPTTAQTVRQAQAQQAKFNAGLPNPLALPNLRMVSPGTGATVGSSTRPPIDPHFGGSVAALTAHPAAVAPHPSSPSPSHAAGVQHGRTIALRAVAAPAANRPSTPSAAPHGGPRPKPKPAKTGGATPSSGGAASVTDLLNSGTSFTLQDLLKHAGLLAQGDVNQEVAAYQGLQDQERSRAAEQAKQILAASQAAAGMLGGIGNQTQAGITNAANDIAGLAGGFSGGLRTTASADAQKVLDQLASVGATNLSPQAQAQPGALSNLAYGLGGYLPASALLTGGAALAAAQRQLPASTLAYGGQQAQGTIGAGNAAARQYDSNIAAALAKKPGLTNQYTSQLEQLASNEQSQARDAALAESLIGSRSAQTKIAGYNAQTSRYNAQTARQRAETAASQRAESLGIQDARLKLDYIKAQTSATAKKKNLGLSSKDWQQQNALALGAARNYHAAWTDDNGATQTPLSWQQYLTHGLAAKIPIAILISQGRKVYSQDEIKQGLIPGG